MKRKEKKWIGFNGLLLELETRNCIYILTPICTQSYGNILLYIIFQIKDTEMMDMKCELSCLHPNDYEKSLNQNEIETDIFSFDIMKPTHLVEKVPQGPALIWGVAIIA